MPGHRYGLIGRNGKGKSTLLRWFASRRIKGLPKLLSVHYVAQEIPLAVMNEGLKPADMVRAVAWHPGFHKSYCVFAVIVVYVRGNYVFAGVPTSLVACLSFLADLKSRALLCEKNPQHLFPIHTPDIPNP